MKSKKTEVPKKSKEKNVLPASNGTSQAKKTIEHHKMAAAHHMEAAKHHMDAAKHYESGDYGKAAHSTLLAHGHHTLAGEFLSDDAKHHAQTLKVTTYHT